MSHRVDRRPMPHWGPRDLSPRSPSYPGNCLFSSHSSLGPFVPDGRRPPCPCCPKLSLRTAPGPAMLEQRGPAPSGLAHLEVPFTSAPLQQAPKTLGSSLSLMSPTSASPSLPLPSPPPGCDLSSPVSSLHQYLLSMVIAYFSRAGLFSWQFRPIHFFLAL